MDTCCPREVSSIVMSEQSHKGAESSRYWPLETLEDPELKNVSPVFLRKAFSLCFNKIGRAHV